VLRLNRAERELGADGAALVHEVLILGMTMERIGQRRGLRGFYVRMSTALTRNTTLKEAGLKRSFFEILGRSIRCDRDRIRPDRSGYCACDYRGGERLGLEPQRPVRVDQ
jgi:hypothetical protein